MVSAVTWRHSVIALIFKNSASIENVAKCKCIFSDPIIYDDYDGGAAKKLAIIELIVGGVAIGMNVAAIVMELENSYDGSFIGSGIFVRLNSSCQYRISKWDGRLQLLTPPPSCCYTLHDVKCVICLG